MAAIDLLALVAKNNAIAGGSFSGLDKSYGLGDVSGQMAPGSPDEGVDKTEQTTVATPSVSLTPSQMARAGGNALMGYLGMLTANPLTFGQAFLGMNNLQQRGNLGQKFDALFGVPTDAEIAGQLGVDNYGAFAGLAGGAIGASSQAAFDVGQVASDIVGGLSTEDAFSNSNFDWNGIDFSGSDFSSEETSTDGPTSDFGGASGSDY